VSEGLLGRLRRALAGAPHADGERAPLRIRLVVGLGNPGKEYAGNRHNAGFWTLNRFARRHGASFEGGGRAALATITLAGREIALAKPRSFVNESGPAVWDLIKRLKLDDAQELLVVCDDIDLPPGAVRLRPRGGDGGYRGLRSIIDATRSDAFPRLRIGIGRPVVDGRPSYAPDVVAGYVLSDPPPTERDQLDRAVERAIEVIEAALVDGVEAAMQRYN
jgi:PTH1 family peptidyl-tRNA hydrolase